MSAEPSRNMPPPLRNRHLGQALEQLPVWRPILDQLATGRAETLKEDHRRVREAAKGAGEYRVVPTLPVDVMGVFVLAPS